MTLTYGEPTHPEQWSAGYEAGFDDANKWQPIETAPKGVKILAKMKNGAVSVIVWLNADHPDVDYAGWYEHWHFDPVEPEHWMPLPGTKYY